MTDEHKTALAEGRAQGRVVRACLEALESNKPKRGRKRTPDSIRARLVAIDLEQSDANALQRLQLTQERMDLTTELEQLEAGDGTHLATLEAEFIKVRRRLRDPEEDQLRRVPDMITCQQKPQPKGDYARDHRPSADSGRDLD